MSPVARFRWRIAVATLALQCGCPALLSCARAQGIEVSGGAYAGTLGAGAATAEDRLALGANPAAISPGTFGLAMDWHRPYGIPGLGVGDFGVYRDAERLGLAAHWRDTGVEGLYREEDFEGTVSWSFFGKGKGKGNGDVATVASGKNSGEGIIIGYSLLGSQSEIYGEAKTFAARQSLGAIWHPLPTLAFGGFVRGFPEYSFGDDFSRSSQRVVEFGATARTRCARPTGSPGDTAQPETGIGQSLSLDFRKNGDTPWKTLAALTLSPHPCLRICVGLANPPFQASLGIALDWGRIRILQALRYHRYLGQTWLSGIQFLGRN